MWNEEAGSKWGRLLGALSQTPSIAAVSSRYSSTASLVGNAVHGVQPLAPESGGGLPREERAPLKQSHACNGRRSIHASSVVADTENQDGQSGISKVVSDMIEYCNTCRSKGSHVEALRILETAEQAASQASGIPQEEVLGRIRLAKAAVQCDRCEYQAALDTLRLNIPDLATKHSDNRLRHISDASLHAAVYIMLTIKKDEDARELMESAVKADPSREELFERTDLRAAVAAALGHETPAENFVKAHQRKVMAEAFDHCASGPFVEERETDLLAGLRGLTKGAFGPQSRLPDSEAKDWLETMIECLGPEIERARAISGDDHPRVALHVSLLGRIYAKMAELPGEGEYALLAEAFFKSALKILEGRIIDGPKVVSSGAYFEATDLTKACLAAVLRKNPMRVSEADRLASAVKDRRLLEDGALQRAFILGLEGRVHRIVGKLDLGKKRRK